MYRGLHLVVATRPQLVMAAAFRTYRVALAAPPRGPATLIPKVPGNASTSTVE